MANIIDTNHAKKYICELCNYSSNNKRNYNNHIQTIKHKTLINANNANNANTDHANSKLITDDNICDCGKSYKHLSSLSRHKKKCKFSKKVQNTEVLEEKNNKEDVKDMIIKMMKTQEVQSVLLKENQELRKQLQEQSNQITELIPKVGVNNNTINQRFNINVFLNEKCKNALSIDEFVEKIEISMKHLITTKNRGQPQGITNIIMDNMNKLSLYERPLHCTDKKRETLYIKNKEWIKDEDNQELSKALKKVESKQLKNIQLWLDAHPNYMNIPKEQEEFTKLLSECGKSADEGREKIVKNICNKVFIEKD